MCGDIFPVWGISFYCAPPDRSSANKHKKEMLLRSVLLQNQYGIEQNKAMLAANYMKNNENHLIMYQIEVASQESYICIL
jgi:hypothetical protein